MQLDELRTGQIVQCKNQFLIVLGVKCTLYDILTNYNEEEDIKILLYNIMSFPANYDKEFFQCEETKAFLRKVREYKLSNLAESFFFRGCSIETIEL